MKINFNCMKIHVCFKSCVHFSFLLEPFHVQAIFQVKKIGYNLSNQYRDAVPSRVQCSVKLHVNAVQ